LAAVENSELLALDALHGSAPAIWACLGTRTATLDPRPFYDARRLVMRALKRRWPEVEYACLVEFTTGYGPRSGGRRRPHWNLLLKGIPAADVDLARELVARVWCQHVDAAPGAQYVGVVSETGGLMRYLAHHFQKESQAPPPGWRGHRFIKSRGYLWAATPAARRAAREALRLKRELHRAHGRGLTGTDAEAAAASALGLAAATTWELVHHTRPPAPADPGAPASVDAVVSAHVATGVHDDLLLVAERLVAGFEAGESHPPRGPTSARTFIQRPPEGLEAP
jgi:hypothetical protein